MKNRKNKFLKEFLKQRKQIGSAIPSSKVLVKKMLEKIDFDSSDVIVEFGAGLGAFTRELLKNIKPQTKIFVFELHTPFYENLIVEFANNNNVIIINDSAENCKKYLTEEGIENVDVVVSSLPLTNIANEVVEKILEKAFDILTEEGTFLQYQYSLESRKKLRNTFDSVDTSFTLINFPPAFIYSCKKK